LDVALRADEIACREGLEADRAQAGRLESQLDVERDRRRRQREQPLACWSGELLAAEQDVPETHAWIVPKSGSDPEGLTLGFRPGGPSRGRSCGSGSS